MAPSKPLIYAELLSNIRQISVITALNTPCDPTTKVELSENGCQFILFHHGESLTLDLPGQASPNARLQKPVLGRKELSWRLPLAGQVQRANQEDAQNCDAPFSAKSLSADEEFSCKRCGAVILKRGSIKKWKDLPSENWADMMDFWHCHKPDVVEGETENSENGHIHDPKDTRKALTERGYGANSKFAAQRGVGFVDITTFLVSEKDCTNITSAYSKPSSLIDVVDPTLSSISVSSHSRATNGCASSTSVQTSSLSPTNTIDPSSGASNTAFFPSVTVAIESSTCSLPSKAATKSESLSAFHNTPNNTSNKISVIPLRCVSCSTILGYFDSGYRILKWLICYSSPSSGRSNLSSSQLYSFPTFFPPLALAMLREQLSSKILLSPMECLSLPTTSRSTLLLWIIASGLRCSSTSTRAYVPIIKLFWRVVGEDAAKSLRDTVGVEELEQPAEAIIELECALQESALWLPPSSRRFQEWNVGLLEKYVDE